MDTTITRAVEVLKKGGVILLPTETLYGIAADASSKSAIERIYDIKNRDLSKPLQVMVPNLAEAEKIAIFNDKARALAQKFWPGPLTIVLKMKQDALPNNFNKVNDTVGIRIPNHIIALEILRGFGKPVVATSANISGQSPNIDFAEAKRTIGAKLDHLVDGGLSKVGVGSTVVDYTDENDPKILREGSIEVL